MHKPISSQIRRYTEPLFLAAVLLISADMASSQPPSSSNEPTVAADELPRTAPKSPEESKACIQVLPGFEIELVAAEPLVVDPVAFAFDAGGRLFVAEMIDYSERESDALGRIALLEDLDGDGKMDKRSTFVDKLSWPTAVHPWKDGVIVIAPPSLTWFRDTDNDGRSDVSEEWYTGFGRSNVQGMANSLRWNVDGYLIGVTSSTGAELTSSLLSNERRLLRGRDFRIDAMAKKIAPLSGGSQNGMAVNRWGDRFVTSNSDHLQQIIDLDDWLQSHSVGSLPIATRRSIAVDGPQAEVFRASPVEPWRIVRTQMRVSGKVAGAIEGGGRAAGYFTGASGTWLMDAEAGFGIDGFDTAFVCDSGSNLVHRKPLAPNGLFWTANRMDDQTELVRSSEVWFRPVQLGDGPDGALYIADMYREVIEHPKSIPPAIKEHLDLNSGNDRGRIWRVRRTDSRSTSRFVPAQASNAELVELLRDPIAWRRRTASQLLIEREALDVGAGLRQLIDSRVKPETAVLALHLLNRLGLLDAETLQAAAGMSDPRLNRHALDLIRSQPKFLAILNDKQLVQTLMRKADDARLCLSLAMAAADLPAKARMEILRPLTVQALKQHAVETTLISILVAASGTESRMLLADRESLSVDEKTSRKKLLQLLVPYWAQRLSSESPTSDESLSSSLREVIHDEIAGDESNAFEWLAALLGLKNRELQEKFVAVASLEDRKRLIEIVETELTKASVSPKLRPSTAAYLRLATPATRLNWLEQFINPREPDAVQISIVDACLFADPKSTARFVLEHFAELVPKLRETAAQKLIEYPEATTVLADAIEKQQFNVAQLSPALRQTLDRHPNAALRKRFAGMLDAAKPTNEEIQQIIDRYVAACDAADSTNAGVLERGKLVFEKNCAACHRIDNFGNDVGPPLKSLHEKSPAQLLVSILDPNREVDPRFQAWVVLLEDGRVVTGVIREESANQIVLAEPAGKLSTIERDEIEQLKAGGVSLMPTGLHQQLTADNAAELIAWLRSRK